MQGEFFSELVQLIDHRPGFVLSEGGDMLEVFIKLRAVHGDLHHIHTIFSLVASFCDLFFASSAYPPGEVFGRFDPAGESVTEALTGGDYVAAGRDPANVPAFIALRTTTLHCPVARYHHRGVVGR